MWKAIAIREILEADAEAYLALCNRLDEETTFRLYEPGERRTSPEQQRRMIRDVLAWDNSTILVAEKDGALIGCLEAYGGKFHRDWHSVYIAVGVLQTYSGKGVGTQLCIELERWALEREVNRLELTVMVNNRRAIALYQKMGFEIEGRKRHALRVDGLFVDEYLMARLLD